MKKQTTQTFSDRVVKITLAIPKGRVTTYGRIARAAGAGPMASQSITSILDKYEKSIIKNTRPNSRGLSVGQVPFHRIVYADGHIWVSSSRRTERLKLYKKEGIEIDKNDRIVNFRDILLEFK